jgi:hypothetical protein
MMSIREMLAAAAAGWCLSLALPASAAGQVGVGAALALSTQAAGASDSPYLGPGFGGTHLGSVVSLDVDVGRTVSAGGEFSTAGDISGSQVERVSGGSNSLLSEHHDTVASAVVKFKVPTTNRLHVAGVGGFGFARRQTERTGTFGRNFPPFATTPVTEHLSDTVLAVTGGVDGVVAIRRGLGILALLRIHVLADDDRLPDGVVHRGVSSVILRYGVGAQVRF